MFVCGARGNGKATSTGAWEVMPFVIVADIAMSRECVRDRGVLAAWSFRDAVYSTVWSYR